MELSKSHRRQFNRAAYSSVPTPATLLTLALRAVPRIVCWTVTKDQVSIMYSKTP